MLHQVTQITSQLIALIDLWMTPFWEPASRAVLATDSIIIPTADLPSIVRKWGEYMTINAIITMSASFPFGARRRFDNPSHCRGLLLRKFIIMRVLTLRKETLREIIFVARFIREIADEA